MMNKIFCCDWGTTNLRLRLVDIATGLIIAELNTEDGIASVHTEWKKTTIARGEFYTRLLMDKISILQQQLNIDETEKTHWQAYPIIISGMASSTLGIKELPYADLPFSAKGDSVVISNITTSGLSHHVMLISGVKSGNDVMRGEETQWLGLMQDKRFSSEEELLFILPGTHSKHVHVRSGNMVAFKTYMTGEFFNLLSTQSVLKNSVSIQKRFENAAEKAAFLQGVEASSTSNLLHEAFMIRTNQVFGKMDLRSNGFYLSGLLIGSELRHATGYKIVLAAGTELSSFYEAALQHLDKSDEFIIVSGLLADMAVVTGQLVIFKKISGVNA